MRITAITPGYYEPSSRFRIRQYIPNLNSRNISVKEFWSVPPLSYKLPGYFGSIRQRYLFPVSGAVETAKFVSLLPSIFDNYRSDLIWMNRPAHNLVHFENYFRNPVYFDVDDAIWLGSEGRMKKIAKGVNFILAGNSFIADWFSQFNDNIYHVPTGIDTKRFVSDPEACKDEKFIIGWTGSKDGLRFIYEIEEYLNIFIKSHKNIFIKIICDKKPAFKVIAPEKTIFIPWNPLTENTELQDISVGIMPLTDNDWSRGKCSFKMLQYMSTSIPVIVSDFGMNSEVLAKSEIGYGVKKNMEWAESLEALYVNHILRNKLGENGRALIEKEYSVDVIAELLSEIFLKTIMKV